MHSICFLFIISKIIIIYRPINIGALPFINTTSRFFSIIHDEIFLKIALSMRISGRATVPSWVRACYQSSIIASFLVLFTALPIIFDALSNFLFPTHFSYQPWCGPTSARPPSQTASSFKLLHPFVNHLLGSGLFIKLIPETVLHYRRKI